ncbi:N-acetylneuraminate synthase family protein [Thalassospira sp.]|uniref:N-acetylneuraminate synthase family protein n=1 Tax=Thalassospira sp. TaxID=1912094 RepID=UPI001B101CE8|nr:N-acetylneuraminate synthase family protein [Thalassospira sp.]MBO6805956.1 N-acetylneuraminate synthase family protein [Thalassospira sp.]
MFEVIAEFANAHQGKVEKAEEMVRRFSDVGADALKFQIYFAEELLTIHHRRYEHFKKQAFNEEAWARLLPLAKHHSVNVYCDVFGHKALEIAVKYGADGVKLHASDLGDLTLVAKAASLPGKVFLSAGGALIRELDEAVELVVAAGKRPVIMHGFQAYPTRLEDTGLARMDWLIDMYGANCDIGFADHIAGDDPFALCLPVHALGRGAKVIEKHVTLDRSEKGVDYYSSLEPDEFKQMMMWVRSCEAAVGATPTSLSDAELHYRSTVKKHWVAARDFPVGHTLRPGDIVMKRVEQSPSDPLRETQLIGRKIVCEVKKDEIVTREQIETIIWALPVARSKSSRLPGKASLKIAGETALGHLFRRLKQSDLVDKIVFCTTEDRSDDELVEIASAHGVDVYRGETDNVLKRMLGALGSSQVDIVLRVTGDDILVDPDYIGLGVKSHLSQNAEYTDLKSLPSGTEVEIFDVELLKDLSVRAEDLEGTEYLTNYVTDNSSFYKLNSAEVKADHQRDWRLTLDTEEDLALLTKVLEYMKENGKAFTYRMDDLVDFFAAFPSALQLNGDVRQRSKPIRVNTKVRLAGWKET